MKDLIIIGAGPAGLAASIYAKRAGLDAVTLEKNPMAGGQIIDTYEVDNYPGLPGIGGFELAMKWKEHADKLGCAFADGEVTGLETVEGEDRHFVVHTAAGPLEAKALILATGATHAMLGVPGEESLRGAGVSYCATCDGAFFRDKTAMVVGGGDVALEDALFLARGCSKVYLVHRRDAFRGAKILQDEVLSNERITVLWDSVVKEIAGDGVVQKAVVENVKTKEVTDVATDAVFIAVGITPNTSFLNNFVECDEKGFIRAGEDKKTSVPGVFAAGDVRTKRLRQVLTGASDGAEAVTAVEDYLHGQG